MNKKVKAEMLPHNTKKINRQASQDLFKKADKFLDVRALFPKSKIDLRKGLTRYQTDTIKKSLHNFGELAGGIKYLESDFAPAVKNKSMKKYMSDVHLPKNARGVLLSGGSKLKSKVTIKNGGLHYLAGERDQFQYPLNATSEKTLVASIKKLKSKINKKNTSSFIGTHGGKIHYSGASANLDGDKTIDVIINSATGVYNKYVLMAQQNLKRDNGRFAAHPSKWGMVLISEPDDFDESED